MNGGYDVLIVMVSGGVELLQLEVSWLEGSFGIHIDDLNELCASYFLWSWFVSDRW